jgi:hypothetical protein
MALSFFLCLLLGHVVGDFLLQPYWLVIAKRNGWQGLLIHVGVVTFVTAILLWNTLPNWWVWVIVLYLGHLLIDQFRTFVFTDNTKGKGLLLLALDQLAHVALIMLLAWAATGWRLSDLQLLLTESASDQHRLMVYLIGLAIAIGVVPVLEAEVTVAVWAAQGHEVKKTLQINLSDRVLGGMERVVATLLILFGYGLFSPLVFLPRLALMVYQGQASVDRAAVATKVITSFLATVLISYLLHNIPTPLYHLAMAF